MTRRGARDWEGRWPMASCPHLGRRQWVGSTLRCLDCGDGVEGSAPSQEGPGEGEVGPDHPTPPPTRRGPHEA